MKKSALSKVMTAKNLNGMNDKTKSAKEHYANLFEGLRLVVCSSVMLTVCGVKWTADKIGSFRKRTRKETFVNAEIVEIKRAN